MAAAIATGRRLADVLGRDRTFRVGVLLFATGSLLSGLSVNRPWLLGSRVLEGLVNILIATPPRYWPSRR